MSQIQAFDFSINLIKALLWQYNSALKLQSLLESKQTWYDANYEQFWNNWYDDVFNLQTANEFGLSVWAIILQLPIVVESTLPAPSRPTFGFEEYRRNFNRGNFYSGKENINILSLNDARIALLLRYYQITSRPTVTEINRVFSIVFADYGPAWVEDNLDMTITFHYAFDISSQLLEIITGNDLFMRPSAVGSTYEHNYLVYNGADAVFNGADQVIV